MTHKRRKAKNRKWLSILQNWGKIMVLPGIRLSPLTPSSLLSNETGRVLPALVRALPGIAGIAGVADNLWDLLKHKALKGKALTFR